MFCKILALVAFVASLNIETLAGGFEHYSTADLGHHEHHGHEQYHGHEQHHEHEEHHSHPKYEYKYSIEDPHTGDYKSQHETRDGDVVKGEYSLLDADGTIRKVQYTADKHSGFQAIVTKDGHVIHPAEPVTDPHHAQHQHQPEVHQYQQPIYSHQPEVHQHQQDHGTGFAFGGFF